MITATGIVSALKREIPGIRVEMDAYDIGHHTVMWFDVFDVKTDQRKVAIEWHLTHGLGLHLVFRDSTSYGSSPDEIYQEIGPLVKSIKAHLTE